MSQTTMRCPIWRYTWDNDGKRKKPFYFYVGLGENGKTYFGPMPLHPMIPMFHGIGMVFGGPKKKVALWDWEETKKHCADDLDADILRKIDEMVNDCRANGHKDKPEGDW